MAIIDMNNTRVGRRGDHVILEVPIDGRKRMIRIDPTAAIQIANQVASAAVEMLPSRAPASLVARDVALKPYDANGHAHLAILTDEHGPFVFGLDSAALQAFASSAAAALEFASGNGSA